MRLDINRWPNAKRPDKDIPSTAELRKRKLCDWCDKANAVMLHHIDCNPSNNDIENLEHLCNSCHRKRHSHFPNWKHLHDEEIRFIIKEANRILNESNPDMFQYTEPLGDQYTETTKEEQDAMMADIMNHPLPY